MTKPTELYVGGQTYRVNSSASPEELERLAAMVDDKLSALVPPGRPMRPEALLLAAISLAHELEEVRARERQLLEQSRTTVTSLLTRVTRTIGRADESLSRSQSPSKSR